MIPRVTALRAAMIAAGFLAAAGAARANDSTAQLGAGGLTLVPNAGVEMAREDLYVSKDEIRIAYEFVNKTDKPITTLVAFPLPVLSGVDVGFNTILPVDDDPKNFVGFEVSVDGRKVAPQVEQRATVRGIDVTAQLLADGLPLNPFSGNAREAFEKLAPEKRGFYELRGMAAWSEGAIDILSWDVSTTFYWEQTFEPGRTAKVTHRYKPVIGQSLLGLTTLNDARQVKPYRADHCLDQPTEAGIRKRLGEEQKKVGKDGFAYLSETRLDYILKTARNWGDSMIADFRLTIEKPAPESILSLCWDGKLQKVSPTRFEFRAKDFAPERDLKLLFLDPAPQN